MQRVLIFITILMLLIMYAYFIAAPAPTQQLSVQNDSTNIAGTSDTSMSVIQTDTIKVPLEYPEIENNAFAEGEKLTFKVRYGFIRAGTATMEVMPGKEIRGNPVYHIQTRAESAAAFNWVYEVRDVVDSYMDKRGLFSWKFDKRLREGGYMVDLLVDYFPEDSLADVHYTRFEDEETIRDQDNYQVKTPPFSLDVLAAFYYIRTQELEVGKVFTFINHDNKKVYDLEVHVYPREIAETAAGNFNCFVVEPFLKGEGLFQQKGKLRVWMTDDKFKIPVQMKSEVAVGHITTELEEISGINERIPSKMEY
jgi:hypothetical protein